MDRLLKEPLVHFLALGADEVDMPAMHVSIYSLAETFDVGRNTGTQVPDLYLGVFQFEGALDRVVINLSDEVVEPADVLDNLP